MKLTDIKNLTNTRLAGEQLTYSALVPYFDAVVDEINEKLHACFKTFSEINPTGTGDILVYEEFPDKYIRTVVCLGAAAKWYIDDEEGIETATALKQQYDNNLFIMVRDYGPLIPENKKRNDEGGFFKDPNYIAPDFPNPNYRYQEVPGVMGTSVEDARVIWKEGKQYLQVKLVSYDQATRWVDCGVIDTGAPIVMVNQNLPVSITTPKYTLGIEVEDA